MPEQQPQHAPKKRIIKVGNANHTEVGKIGEAAVLQWLTRKGGTVIDARDSSFYRLRDVDYVTSDGKAYEVKTDAKAATTGNIIFETARDHGGPGCFYRSKADYWIYCVLGETSSIGYIFELSRAQSWLTMNLDKVQLKSLRAHRGKVWVTYVGAVVPLDIFLAAVPHDTIIF